MLKIVWIDNIKDHWNQIKDSSGFKVFVSPLWPVLVNVAGNTAGIWFGWILIKYVLFGFFDNLKWPGMDSLINEGVLLLVSFSFLSTIIYESSKRWRINVFNAFGFIMLLAVCLSYTRAIGLRQVQKTTSLETEFEPDKFVFVASLCAFFGSIILLYSLLARDRYVRLSGAHPASSRGEDGDELKKEFHAGT